MFKKLFSGLLGSGDAKPAAPKKEREAIEYKGFLIIPDPQDVGGQYRVSGWIRKPVEGGETLERRFERSDVVPGEDACVELTVAKSQRYIDDIGDEMFEQEH